MLLGIGFAVVIIGFILMSGSASTEQAFEADIFSVRRTKVAPVVCFIGFVSMIYAVMHKPKDTGDGTTAVSAEAPPSETVETKQK